MDRSQTLLTIRTYVYLLSDLQRGVNRNPARRGETDSPRCMARRVTKRPDESEPQVRVLLGQGSQRFPTCPARDVNMRTPKHRHRQVGTGTCSKRSPATAALQRGVLYLDSGLLFGRNDGVLHGLRHAEFDHFLGRNLDGFPGRRV